MRVTTVAEKFYNTVKVRWPLPEEHRVLETIGAVIGYLRKRLPPQFEERLITFLPQNLATISSMDESEEMERIDGHPVISGDIEELLEKVRAKGGFSDQHTTKNAAVAVLATLIEHLPAQEALQIRTHLPKGIQQLWVDAVKIDGFSSLDMGLFRENMRPRFHGHTANQIDTTAQIVIASLIHRIGSGEEKNILPHVPEEIRIAIGHPYAHANEEENVNEPIDAERLLERVINGAHLKDRYDAQLAVIAVFHALKGSGVTRDSKIDDQLTLDWRVLWEAA